jgi:hypothetical protein
MSEETNIVLEEVLQPTDIISFDHNEPVDAEFTEVLHEPRVESREELKRRLRAEKIASIHAGAKEEFSNLLLEASTIQKNITNAKTKIKKDYFSKKMEKVTHHMRQVVGILQQLETLATPSEGSDNAIIESTVTAE